MTDRIINWLLDNGFKEGQEILNPKNAVRIAGNRFVTSGYSRRRKFCEGNIRVTVGPRSVCVYDISNPGIWNMQVFKTADIENIKEAAGEKEK